MASKDLVQRYLVLNLLSQYNRTVRLFRLGKICDLMQEQPISFFTRNPIMLKQINQNERQTISSKKRIQITNWIQNHLWRYNRCH